MIGIYKITNPKGKIYIGQSINIVKRFTQYRSTYYKKQYKLYYSIQKYGYDQHIFEVIEECKFEDLNIRERYWQDFYDVLSEKGLNCKLTQTVDKPAKHSEETKQKIREKMVGRVMTVQHKSNLSKARLLLPEETRKAAGQHRRGVRDSEEVNKRRSKSLLGVPKSEEAKEKMRKPKSKQHAKNISEGLKGLPSLIKGRPDEQVTCPFCLKTGGNSGMKRWHFNKCQKKKEF